MLGAPEDRYTACAVVVVQVTGRNPDSSIVIIGRNTPLVRIDYTA
jgi:hypothetical protein